MKKLLPVLAIFSWALASCVDDPLAHDNMPVVTLAEPADLKRTSVILEADLDGPDIGSVTEIGFILGENSSLNDNVVKVSVEEVAKGRFSALVKDLQIGHTYFYVAYATNGRQTVKSQVEALTTLTRSSALLGDIEVYEVGDETFLRSSIEDDGGATINMAGFCFDTNENPTIYKGNIQAKLEEDGSFTANVTEYLDEGKTYYLRAFVDNDILGDGTTSISYGLQTVYTMPKIEKVNIPDAVFKAYIVENFDKNGDKEISLKEAAAITEINVNTNDIATLKGVECFENLTRIVAIGSLSSSEGINPQGGLTELDLTSNHLLKFLRCDNNNLTKVSISPEAKLESVDFIYNLNLSSIGSFDKSELKYINLWGTAVEELDLREAANLETIHYNVGNLNIEGLADLKTVKLQSVDGKIDLSKCADLDYLYAERCSLKGLDLSNHPELTHLTCRVCGLTEFDLSHVSELTTLDCGYNKITSGYLDISANRKLTRFNASGCEVHTIYVWEGFEEADYPDFNKDPIAHYVIKGQGYGGPSILSDIPDENFRAYVLENFDYDGNGDVTTEEALEVKSMTLNTDNVHSLEGIKYFENLQRLDASGTTDGMNMTGRLAELDLTSNSQLTDVRSCYNHIETVSLSPEAKLTHLSLECNQELTSVQNLNLTKMKDISFWRTALTELDLREAVDLESFSYNCVREDAVCVVNVEGLSGLTHANIVNADKIIGLPGCTNLVSLDVLWCVIDDLNLNNHPNLTHFRCDGCGLTELDLSPLTELTYMTCSYNKFSSGYLDISANKKLTCIYTDGCGLHTIYVWEGFNEADYPDFHKDASTRYVVKGQGYGGPSILSDIPDENFRAYVLENFDYDSNGDVTTDEALEVKSMTLNTDNVHSLEGIKYFENLQRLDASGTTDGMNMTGGLTELDLTSNHLLKFLRCDNNNLTKVSISPEAKLESVEFLFNLNLSSIGSFDKSELKLINLWGTAVEELDLREAANLETIHYTDGNLNIEGLADLKTVQLQSVDGKIDLSKCADLDYLCAELCSLKGLDLSNHPELTHLICRVCGLTEFDLSHVSELTTLDCGNNKITSGYLDISANRKLTRFNASGCGLHTIYVWEGFNEADYPDFHKDASTRYVVKGQGYGGPSILSDIPDENFRAYVLENFDYDANGDVTTEEALLVESIDLNTDNIYSLEGIRYFENLVHLVAIGTGMRGGKLEKLDISENTKLLYLDCSNNVIAELKLNSNLLSLETPANNLSFINLPPTVEYVNIGWNYLTTLDLSSNTELRSLFVYENQLTELDVASCKELIHIYCNDNKLEAIDVSNNHLLQDLHVSVNPINKIDVTKNPELKTLRCQHCGLTNLDITCNPKLETLIASGRNTLSTLNLENNISLKELNLALVGLKESLDISNNTLLTRFEIAYNPDLHTIYVWEGFNEADYPDFHKDASTRYLVKGQGYGGTSVLSEIPDENFRAYVLENFDYDANGDVTTEEALLVESIDLNTDNIYSLEGIRYFENLGRLVARGTEYYEDWKYRGQLTELDLSYNQKLYNIWCSFNHIKYIKFHPDAAIVNLNIGYNQELTGFSEFDMSQLRYVALRETMVTDLDLRGAVNLDSIEYSYSPDPEIKRSLNIDGLTKIIRMELRYLDGNLDVSNLSNLVYLCADHCNLKELDLRNCSKLKELIVDGNQLTAIDLNGCIMLESLSVPYNLLGELDLHDNMKLTYMNSYGNPDLRTIYVWDGFNEADYPDFYKDETATYVVKQ